MGVGTSAECFRVGQDWSDTEEEGGQTARVVTLGRLRDGISPDPLWAELGTWALAPECRRPDHGVCS